MNAFWDFVDWILPPVRIIDDLADPPEHVHRSRSSHHHHSSRKDHDKGKDRQRDTGGRRERDREQGRGESKETRGSEHEREREQLRQRIQHLERENESLLEQLRATREELSTLSAAAFPAPSSSDRTPQSLSYPASPPDPASIALPVSRAHSRASSEASTSQTPVLTEAAQHSAEAALVDPKRLRVLYTSLRATYADARQVILSQAEELASLKSFLSKTDDWSGAQLLQALADLNAEILQLAASIADEFAPSLRADTHAPSAAKERDREIVEPALGKEMLKLLEEREHAGDPTLVQFALQAWQVWCVSRVMDAFCYGLPVEVDEALRLIFERMQREEPQPTTSRWRALTYKHARSLLARPRMSSEPPSPDAANPSPFNSAPASIVSTTSLPPPLLTLTEANLRGILAILALSGCTDARGLHRDPLRSRFGSALSRISARAERISSVVKEGVLSGLFEVSWVPPCRSPKTASSSRRASTAAAPETTASPASPGGNRGKGKEREWVKEVQRAQSGESQKETEEHWFDWNTMENVYAGYCSEQCRVLCTVELGLAFERRLPEEEKEESVDGDGMLTGSGAARPVAMGGVGVNGVSSGSVSMSVSRSASRDAPSHAANESMIVRNLLLKPKVLLESVVDIL